MTTVGITLSSLLGGLIFGASISPCKWWVFGFIGFGILLALNTFPLRWHERAISSMVWGISSAILPIAFGIKMAKEHFADYPNDFSGWLYALQPFFLLSIFVHLTCSVAGELWLSGKWKRTDWVFLVAAFGVVAEWFTLFLPLPITLAVTQSRSPANSIAFFAGVWGVSWFVWFVAAAVVEMVLKQKLNWTTICCAFLFLIVPHMLVKWLHKNAPKRALKVALIQNGYEEPLTLAAKVRDVELIVLPELALGQETQLTMKSLKELAQKSGAKVVAGFEEANPLSNSAVLVSHNGEELLRYRKIHLFGAERLRYQRGREVKVWNGLGVAICFDTVFPDITRMLAKQGAILVAVPNYDPPVVGFLLHHLHAALLPIRAIENFVGIVKADSFGLSQVIAPDGKIIAEAPLGKTTVLRADAITYPHLQGFTPRFLTPYTLFGDWFVIFCAIIAMLLLIWRIRFA
ncbi:MAG: nitrilase-related carbon-nitrogen hydrolase [Armatimonadota bacterium]|nr:carbon-nitrogen hydrolase family protein [Armatimonadota bacterium]MCX7777434.1 carbon-nitrogen hydrolase family protein [Armatimonadota bacterium]MDW8025103.1 nitrilase-related carbon-nitrogen hydrolase [Armatimonadota bacterium]